MKSIHSLSNEVYLEIGEFCTVPDLARLAQTHRLFYNLFKSRIWERNIRDEPYCDSCLLYAAAHKRLDLLKLALGFGADMNGQPIPRSSSDGEKPKNPFAMRRGGFSSYNLEYIAPRPLHIAVWNGDQEMVDFLLDNGALVDVWWLECQEEYNIATKRLPAFLEPDALKRKPLPSSGMPIDSTLDTMMRQVNWIDVRRPNTDRVHTKLGETKARDLRHMDPLRFALMLPEESDVASTLIEKGSPLPGQVSVKALMRAFRVGNIRTFDRLLELHPESDNDDSPRRRVLYIMGGSGRHVPMEMVRHAFLKLWRPNLPGFREMYAFDSDDTSLIYFSIITGRYREALDRVKVTQYFNVVDDFSKIFLHYVWWDDEVDFGEADVDGVLGVRLPDPNPMQTRLELTKELLLSNDDVHSLLTVSNTSKLQATAIYLAAVGSGSCPERYEAVKLLLEAGHKQEHVVAFGTGENVSLLQYFAQEAARDRDLDKWSRHLRLCLDFAGQLSDDGGCLHPKAADTLDFSMVAWVESDGRRPLFDFFLEHATKMNVNSDQLRGLVDKYNIDEDAPVRNALVEFSERVLGSNE